MGLIGDIFFGFRGDGTKLQADAKREGGKAGTTMGSEIMAGIKKSWSGKEIGKGFIQGLGLAGGLGAATAISNAIGKISDILGDASQAALAEETSIAKLGSSLRANVKDWDGNTDAIERLLKARMRLGFSDDEQRESLARLVGATQDVNKALDLQRTAMDLARFKGISLMEASEALIKVEGGQYRILKTLIGSTKDITNETDALAAVQRVAAGAAEDMAATNEGRLLASQIRIGEEMEQLGEHTLPLLVSGTEAAADAAENLGNVLDFLDDPLNTTSEKTADVGETLIDLAGAVPFVGSGFRAIASGLDGVAVSADHTADSVEALKGSAVPDLAGVSEAEKAVARNAGVMAGGVDANSDKAAESVEDMADRIEDAASDLINKAFDPIIAHDRLMATNAEIAAQKRILASKKSSSAEKADARSTLHSAQKDQAEYILTLARAGKTGSKAYREAIAGLKEQVRTATGPTKTYLQGVINKIEELERKGATVPINVVIRSLQQAVGKGAFKAEGGPVRARVPYIVGEEQPEVFVPRVPGTIYPSIREGLEAVGAGGGDVTNFNLTIPVMEAPDPFETTTQLRRLADQKVLTVPRKRGRAA